MTLPCGASKGFPARKRQPGAQLPVVGPTAAFPPLWPSAYSPAGPGQSWWRKAPGKVRRRLHGWTQPANPRRYSREPESREGPGTPGEERRNSMAEDALRVLELGRSRLLFLNRN